MSHLVGLLLGACGYLHYCDLSARLCVKQFLQFVFHPNNQSIYQQFNPKNYVGPNLTAHLPGTVYLVLLPWAH